MSETITRTDLTNILNEVLPPMTLNPWVSISATGFTGNNTATKVTGTTIRSGGNASDYFDTSVSNQVTIKRAGTYKITIFFRVSAITSAGNVKRISCYNNGSEFCVAMSRTNSWEDVQSTTIAGCSIGDVLTMYRRAEDGNSTYAPALILIEAVSSTSGNTSAEADYVVEQGTSGIWTYRKWNSGIAECWGQTVVASSTYAANGGYKAVNETLPSGLFNVQPPVVMASGRITEVVRTSIGFTSANNTATIQTYLVNEHTSQVTKDGQVFWIVKGTWK